MFEDDEKDLSSGNAAPPTAQPSPAAGSTAAEPAAGAASAQVAPAPASADTAGSASATANGAAADGNNSRELGEAAGVAPIKDTTTVKGNSFGNRMLHGILGALGGTEDVSYSRDANGKMVVTKVASGPGSQWKRIIAGALSGAAAGAAAPPGPGQLGRAAGAGFGAGENLALGVDDRARANANQDFEMQQKAMVTKGQHALLTQQIAASAWEMKRSKIQFSMDMAKEFNSVQGLISTDATHQDLGTYPSFADFMAKNNGKDTGKGLTDQLLQAVPEVDKEGNVIGVHGYKMTPGWGAKRNADPVQIDMGGVVNGEWKSDWQTIPANGKTNDEIMTLKNAQTAKKSQFEIDRYKEGQQNKREEMGNQATVSSANIHAKATVDAAKIGAESRVAVAGVKATRADVKNLDDKYIKPANDVEKSYQMMQHAYDEYQQAKANGQELPTGAQSMQLLSAHIQNTFGAGKNVRITSDLIKKHMGAIGVSDKVEVAINRLKNGDTLSPDQWDAFHDLVSKSRQLTWDAATKEADRKNVKVDFLPDDLNKAYSAAHPAGPATGKIRVKTSDGAMWDIDANKLDDAKKQDPKLEVMENK